MEYDAGRFFLEVQQLQALAGHIRLDAGGHSLELVAVGDAGVEVLCEFFSDLADGQLVDGNRLAEVVNEPADVLHHTLLRHKRKACDDQSHARADAEHLGGRV